MALRRHTLPRYWLGLTLGGVALLCGAARLWEQQLPLRLREAARRGDLDACLRYSEQLAALRWLQRSSRHFAAKGSTVHVLETVGLAPGRTLHLIVVGNKTLLIGATDHQLSLLTELPDAALPLPQEDNAFDQALSRATETTSSLSEWQSVLDHLRAGVRRMRQAEGE